MKKNMEALNEKSSLNQHVDEANVLVNSLFIRFTHLIDPTFWVCLEFSPLFLNFSSQTSRWKTSGVVFREKIFNDDFP